MWKLLTNLLLLVGMGILQISAANAQTTPENRIPSGVAPDVQIVVVPYSNGAWGVTAVYPRIVGKPVAVAHIKRLLKISGWKIGTVEYEARGMGLRRRDGKALDSDAPDDRPMTSATFTTTANLVDWQSGTMAFEPFAQAYRDLSRVYIIYMVPAKFGFRGVRRYSDGDLDVAVADNGAAYTYLLNIKNHRIESLKTPKFDRNTSNSGHREANMPKTGTTGTTSTTLLVTVGSLTILAISMGALVYVWLARGR